MMSSMKKIDHPLAVDEPVGSEGGRSPSTLPTGRAAPSAPSGAKPGPLAPGQRWSVARKREVVLRLLRGESAELLSRELGVPMFKLERWRQRSEAALDGALKEREADPADGRLSAAMQRIGELSMEVELLRARLGALPQGGPALWAAGCRADGPGDLPRQRPALRRPARLPGLGRAALQLLRRPPADAVQRRAACAGAAWPEACHLRPGSADGDRGRPRALALDRRGQSQGLMWTAA